MNNRLNNSPNVRMVAFRIAPNGNSASLGKIDWSIIYRSSTLLTSVGISGSDLVLHFDRLVKVQSLILTPNKALSAVGVYVGANIDNPSAVIPVSFYQKVGTQGGFIRGDATTFTLHGDIPNGWSTSKTVSDFQYAPPNSYTTTDTTVRNATATYVGLTANRAVAKILSGLTLTFGHRLINNTTMAAVGANTSADIIDIMANTPSFVKLPSGRNDSQGWPGANVFTTASEINGLAIIQIH